MEQIQAFLTSENFFWSIIVILTGLLIYLIVMRIINAMLKRRVKHVRIARRRTTYLKMARSLVRWLMIIIIILALLQVNGVNITSLLAGLGIGAIIAGLALQDAFKDIIMGFNLIVDDYFAVGDVVEYNKHRGVVLELALKVTKIRSIKDGGIYTIANRNITEAYVVSRQLDLDLPIAYEHKTADVEVALTEAMKEMSKIPEIESVEYKGLNEFDESAINYKLRLMVKPELQDQARRDANRIIKEALEKHKISIPYPQVTIHKA